MSYTKTKLGALARVWYSPRVAAGPRRNLMPRMHMSTMAANRHEVVSSHFCVDLKIKQLSHTSDGSKTYIITKFGLNIQSNNKNKLIHKDTSSHKVCFQEPENIETQIWMSCDDFITWTYDLLKQQASNTNVRDRSQYSETSLKMRYKINIFKIPPFSKQKHKPNLLHIFFSKFSIRLPQPVVLLLSGSVC